MAVTQAEIDAMRAAYRRLIAGEQVAEVRHGNKIVRYAAGDAARLAQEIDRAEAELAGRPRRASGRRIMF